MWLKICDEGYFTMMASIEYIILVGSCICFLCFLGYMVFDKISKFQKYSSGMLNFVFGLYILLVIVLILLFAIFSKDYTGCQCAVINNVVFDNKMTKGKIKDIKYNKVFIIGDSRMELIENDKKNIDIPINFSFIAKSNTRINWFESVALKKIEEELKNIDDDYQYHVVINMGVNDLQEDIVISERVSRYFDDYVKLVKKYPKVKFYILSVNPINDDKLNISQPYNIRTTTGVEKFNNLLIEKINNEDRDNLVYCDSYHFIYFMTTDGIHYKTETNKKILKFLTNKCIDYK